MKEMAPIQESFKGVSGVSGVTGQRRIGVE
jgi:hypothetical protein